MMAAPCQVAFFTFPFLCLCDKFTLCLKDWSTIVAITWQRFKSNIWLLVALPLYYTVSVYCIVYIVLTPFWQRGLQLFRFLHVTESLRRCGVVMVAMLNKLFRAQLCPWAVNKLFRAQLCPLAVNKLFRAQLCPSDAEQTVSCPALHVWC